MDAPLQWSRRFLQSVLDGLSAHVCVLDTAGTVLMVNRSWREFARANGGPDERTGVGCSYLRAAEQGAQPGPSHAQEASHFLALLRQVLSGSLRQFQLEYACHSPGEQRWFLARVSRIDASDPPRFVVAHDNITTVKQVQQALQQREASLLDLTASIPGALFRLAHRRTGGWHFIHISPGVEALFGVPASQARADSRSLVDLIVPEDRPGHDHAARKAITQRTVWEDEFRIRLPGGQVKWIHAKAQPKEDEDGQLVYTGMLTDVSERKAVDAALKASESTYRTLYETVPQGIVYQDRDGHITSANPAAQRILGLTLDQMRGMTAVDPHWKAVREDGSELPDDERPSMIVLRTGKPLTDVVMGVGVPGQDAVWILVNATPLFHDGRLEQVVSSFEDITQRMHLSQELARQATTDYLTGAANRRGLMDALRNEFERFLRHPTQRCSVLAIDLDLFKHVNDDWGHAAGDAVLVHVTQLMRQETRLLDLVSRSGGEEFTLLLPGTEPDDAMALAERLRRRVEASPLPFDGRTIAITLSVGVSAMAVGDPNTDAVMARADRALYQAKEAGRNTVRLGAQPG